VSDTALSRGKALPGESAVAALRAKLAVEASQAAVAVRVVYAGTAAYAALFVAAAIIHYVVFKTPRGDLGNMVQAIWNTLHGHFLEATTASGHQRDRLGFHVDPLLLLFVPLFWIWSSPLLLPIVQALAVASGALPVFWVARKHLGSSRSGAHFAFAYLLYPATQFQAFTTADSFHAVSLAVPLVLYAVWFLDEDRLVAFSAVALLAFTTKEEIPLAIGCLGIWYAIRRGRRVFGIGVFAAGLAATLFDLLWVIPHYSPTGADPFAGRYSSVGGTPHGMLHKLFADPMAFVNALASGHHALYLGLLLVPFLGLALLEPLLLLGAVPDLAINLLSNHTAQTSLAYHYSAGAVPFIVAAAVFGAARFSRQSAGLSLAVLATTAAAAVLSPIYVLGNDVKALGSPLVAAEAHAVSLIPDGVPVSASNQLGAHLSERRRIYTFPYATHSRWIIVDINDPTVPVATNEPASQARAAVIRKLRRYKTDNAWRVVFASHGVSVLRKRVSRKG
jgi:uncharacterized membrane protein